MHGGPALSRFWRLVEEVGGRSAVVAMAGGESSREWESCEFPNHNLGVQYYVSNRSNVSLVYIRLTLHVS
jgi:hypothetical protein